MKYVKTFESFNKLNENNNPSVITELGFKFTTDWGDFTIGDKVRLSKEGKTNPIHNDYLNDKILTISNVDMDDEGLGVKQPLMGFTFENGDKVKLFMYGDYIEKVK